MLIRFLGVNLHLQHIKHLMVSACSFYPSSNNHALPENINLHIFAERDQYLKQIVNMAATMEKIKAKVENVIHPHGHTSTGTTHTGTTHTTGTTGTMSTTGTMGTTHNTAHSGIPEGTAGPHTSRIANAVDPRVDSDLDHRGATSTDVGSGHTGHNSGVTGGHTGTGYTSTGATGSTTAGPHSSNLANKLVSHFGKTSLSAKVQHILI